MPCDFRVYGHTYREYFVLRNTKLIGPEIGRLGDVPLHEVLEDEWGRSYRYVGVCPSGSSVLPVPLNTGEFILPPGVVYRMLEGAGAVRRGRSSFLKRLFAFAGRQRKTEPCEQQGAEPAFRWHVQRDGHAASQRSASFSGGRVRALRKRR